MATRKLGDVAVGEIVKLKENGAAVNYIVVHQGKPSDMYDDSCNGTWVVRQKLWIESILSDASSDYENSEISSRLVKFFDTFAENQKQAVKSVKIPCRKGESEYWLHHAKIINLPANVFILSVMEVGQKFEGEFADYSKDGAQLDFFQSDESRIAKDQYGGAKDWWLRTPVTTEHEYLCINNGNFGNTMVRDTVTSYIRPAMILYPDAYVDSDNLVAVNTAPNTPSAITVPETIRGGEDTSIIWSATTDPDENLDGYIVERSYNGGSSWSQIYQGRTTSTTTTIPFGTQTVMFRVQAYDTAGAKSGWRTSANKTVVNNRAPAAPPSISVPLKPAGGEKLTVTWTASSDVDGNLEGYELERQWDGTGAFTQIYKGAALSYQDSIPKGSHTSVVYRVRAYDSFASYSSYTTSQTRQIDNNTAPVIACALSGDLGEKSEGFTIPYTVSDAEQQEVTVTEKVGNLVKRTYKPTLGQQNTFEVTGEYFQKILNGAQTVQIVATDSAGKSSTLQLTFTKAVHRAVITLSEPLAVEKQITVAVLAITGKIPVDAECTVEMTNNGNDPEPNWEDATADVKAGRNHPFQNKTQTNGWAFNFRVTVERGGSDEDGNIVSIQGGFQ